jgi:peptidoglycan-associated lipoprotein
MGSKKKSYLVLLGVLGVLILMGGCHKKVPPPPPPPPPVAPPPPPAPTGNLSAEPATIEKGQSATLSWSSQNATDLDLEPGVGTVQASGSSSVTPGDSTTYVLTIKGPGGTQTYSARVTVTPPPPPPPPPPVQEAHVITTDEIESSLKDAYFDFDKSDVRADAQQTLTADANVLKQFGTVSASIEGDCDERGSEEYNLGLGDRRATAAKNFLVNLGISADRLTTISYGKNKPQCSEHSEDCWQKNRRVHIVVK